MSRTDRNTIRDPRPVIVAAVGFLFAALIAIRVLIPADWNPSVFVAFGEEAAATLEYGEVLLGDIDPRPELGHDGKFFFVQANDPLLLDPKTNATVLDRPIYRSQRMLYPLIAGGFGLLGPWGVAWGMLLVNVLALGIGTWGTAALARQMGGSSWWGLAFGLNIGLTSELAVGGAGAVGFALAVWGLLALERGSNPLAIGLLAASALSREALLLIAAGAAVWAWRAGRRWALVFGLPLATVIAWGVYVRARLGWASGVDDVEEIGWPLVGFVRALSSGRGDAVDATVSVLVLVVLAVLALRVATGSNLAGWATVGFVPLALLFSSQVWLSYFDITRAVAPAITGFVLVVFADRSHLGLGEAKPNPPSSPQ